MTANRYHNFYEDGAVCFWTSAVVGRCPILRSPTAAGILLRTLDVSRKRYEVKVIGYVIMPDHIHIAFWADKAYDAQRFIKRFLSTASYELLELNDTAAASGVQTALRWSEIFHSSPKGKARFWKERGRAFPVTQSITLHQKLTYIHNNPVRASLAERPEDWKFSSASWYTDNTGPFELDTIDW